ncbi:hypothetical protein MGN70_001620 [Eutypa lata]|nr:hypothetical protein MGN70_001620 [Eutypa lata]
MDPNPLAKREKALEGQYIKEKEKQMAKDRAARAQAAKEQEATSQKPGQEKQA